MLLHAVADVTDIAVGVVVAVESVTWMLLL